MKPPYLLVLLHPSGRLGSHTAVWVGLDLPTPRDIRPHVEDMAGTGDRLYLVDGPGEIYWDTITDFGTLLVSSSRRHDGPNIVTDFGRHLLMGSQ